MTLARIRAPLAVARLLVLVLLLPATPGWAADPKPGPPLTIRHITAPIVIDGDLSDAAWQGADSITTWYETNVGDNVEPQVKNVAYLAYDDTYFYAGFNFADPAPATIRAPWGDHDAVSSPTDYGGVIIDSRNDGKTAQMFLANPRGVQYDALTSDASGEDSSPDFFWDCAGKITSTGWTLEIRIPFSSLRYGNEPKPIWGILLYRNYPRDHRYQFFSARLPRDVNCFICNESKVAGLDNLPHGSHLVVAPFATAAQSSVPLAGLGSPLKGKDVKPDGGADVKWNPSADMAIDATWNPDFSQVEADVAQIAANERFALFFPEKRPFFLEGVDLLATPLQAVYTRTVTSPRGGLRATGRFGPTAYTVLVTEDQGGGSVVLPGPQNSDVAFQDFKSGVGVLRLRRDLGLSFVSFLLTAREIEGGGGHNRVLGPDFQWRPKPSDSFSGQFLWSDSRTPRRPDLAAEWDNRHLADQASRLTWSHNTQHVDWYLQAQDLGEDFRADDGFIPQVGYREAFIDAGYTIRPKTGAFSRLRFFTTDYYDVDYHGNALSTRASVGSGADAGWNSFIRLELNQDDVRVGTRLLHRFRPRLYLQSSPGRLLNLFSIDTYTGQEIDFANGREGTGTTLSANVRLRPSEQLELRGDASRRWLDVDAANGLSGRVFTAEVERLRATWSFNAHSFLRLIGQYVQTRRDTSLYTFAVPPKNASFGGSALFAYKLNWQSVLYLGYGDERTFTQATDRLEKAGRQLFTKVSYAWQQ